MGVHGFFCKWVKIFLTVLMVYRYHSQIMVEHLPERIDPLALAEKHRQFKGSLPLSQLVRLQDVLLNPEGEVRFDLRFGKEGKIAMVTGNVMAELELQCQCCLGPIAWPVSSRVKLAVVHSIDEADLLPESYEPLLLEEETILLVDILQEELLLSIPSIPQHGECDASAPKKLAQKPDTPKRPNPFAVLANLKKE